MALRRTLQSPNAARSTRARRQGSTMVGSREPRWSALPCRPFCRRHNALARGGIKPATFEAEPFRILIRTGMVGDVRGRIYAAVRRFIFVEWKSRRRRRALVVKGAFEFKCA